LVKVKVTDAEKPEIPYSRNVKKPTGNNSGSMADRAVKFAFSPYGVFGNGGSIGMTAIIVT